MLYLLVALELSGGELQLKSVPFDGLEDHLGVGQEGYAQGDEAGG